jgi:hypothetical protein
VLLRCGNTSVVSLARALPSRRDADEGPARGRVKVPGRRRPRQLGQPAGVCVCVCVCDSVCAHDNHNTLYGRSRPHPFPADWSMHACTPPSSDRRPARVDGGSNACIVAPICTFAVQQLHRDQCYRFRLMRWRHSDRRQLGRGNELGEPRLLATPLTHRTHAAPTVHTHTRNVCAMR